MSTTVLSEHWHNVLDRFDVPTRARHAKLTRALIDAGFLDEDAARRSVEWIILRDAESLVNEHGVPLPQRSAEPTDLY